MRSAADPERIRDLARALGRVVSPGTRMYLTGGATAVLEGWRDSTLVEPGRLLELFEGIEDELFRFPAVDPASLRAAVESLARGER